MKIMVAGGREQADFLIGLLLQGGHKIMVINSDREYCEYLAQKYGIPIMAGDPCKGYILEEAEADKYEVVIALMAKDADNLSVCQRAKRIHGVKKTVCTVANPKNVEVFKILGVDTVISAAYMLAQLIEQASTVENLIKTLPLDSEKIFLNEIMVDDGYFAVNQRIMDISFPTNTNVACILRGDEVIVPNGQTMIKAGDRLFVIAASQDRSKLVKAISGGGK